MNILLSKVTKETTCSAEILRKPNAESALLCRKRGGGVIKERKMILIPYLRSCPEIGSPTQFKVFQSG